MKSGITKEIRENPKFMVIIIALSLLFIFGMLQFLKNTKNDRLFKNIKVGECIAWKDSDDDVYYEKITKNDVKSKYYKSAYYLGSVLGKYVGFYEGNYNHLKDNCKYLQCYKVDCPKEKK